MNNSSEDHKEWSRALLNFAYSDLQERYNELVKKMGELKKTKEKENEM